MRRYFSHLPAFLLISTLVAGVAYCGTAGGEDKNLHGDSRSTEPTVVLRSHSLSVEANGVVLKRVLRELEEQNAIGGNIDVYILDRSSLDAPVYVAFSGVSLKLGLQRLLRNVDHIIFYRARMWGTSTNRQSQTGRIRVFEVGDAQRHFPRTKSPETPHEKNELRIVSGVVPELSFESLVGAATGNSDPEVRRVSLTLLANKLWDLQDDDTQIFLNSLSTAVHDSHTEVRAAALEAVAEMNIVENNDAQAELSQFRVQRSNIVADVAAADPSPVLRARAFNILADLEQQTGK